jgi:ribosomal protein S18 acetylase RimI-like enzyme
MSAPSDCTIRPARAGDEAGAYYVCLKTGDAGADGEPHFRDDPDALGRIFVGPYLAFEPELALILEDEGRTEAERVTQGVSGPDESGPYIVGGPDRRMPTQSTSICGYALGALDSRAFYARYEREWRPDLCAQFPMPEGPPESWSRVQEVHSWYHQADYFCPEPYDAYPSHLHIDLLPRAQGRGHGGRMMRRLFDLLRDRGSPGVHLGLRPANTRAYAFYEKLGFRELARTGSGNDASIYMGLDLTR